MAREPVVLDDPNHKLVVDHNSDVWFLTLYQEGQAPIRVHEVPRSSDIKIREIVPRDPPPKLVEAVPWTAQNWLLVRGVLIEQVALFSH